MNTYAYFTKEIYFKHLKILTRESESTCRVDHRFARARNVRDDDTNFIFTNLNIISRELR